MAQVGERCARQQRESGLDLAGPPTVDGAPYPLAMRLRLKPHQFVSDADGYMLISAHLVEELQYMEPRFEASPCRPVLSHPSILSVSDDQASSSSGDDYRSLFYVPRLCAHTRPTHALLCMSSRRSAPARLSSRARPPPVAGAGRFWTRTTSQPTIQLRPSCLTTTFKRLRSLGSPLAAMARSAARRALGRPSLLGASYCSSAGCTTTSLLTISTSI